MKQQIKKWIDGEGSESIEDLIREENNKIIAVLDMTKAEDFNLLESDFYAEGERNNIKEN